MWRKSTPILLEQWKTKKYLKPLQIEAIIAVKTTQIAVLFNTENIYAKAFKINFLKQWSNPLHI